jgi:hypothetical protein
MIRQNKSIHITYLLIIVALLLVIGATISNYFVKPEIDVYIPVEQLVNEFCKYEGYTYGWISDDCGYNQVMCYNTKIDSYNCINFKYGR